MTPDVGRLSAHLAADAGGTETGELIDDVVRGVLDEHRRDARPPAPASLLLEVRRRLERLTRARMHNTVIRQASAP